MGNPHGKSSDPMKLVAFVCRECRHAFEAEPGRADPTPEVEHHPWSYWAECPACGEEAGQAAWQRNLLKAWTNPTGPKTAEGKARTAANLAGHPTPAEAQLTRFNAMKHGLFARTATFFPAKPGRYPHCDSCEHLETKACLPQRACLKRAELFLRHQVAFETQDPSLLMGLRGDQQAMISALIDDMLLTIAMDGGPRLKSPEWYSDKDGGFHLAGFEDAETGEFIQLYKLEAHPLLKPVIDFISKNAMTLADLEMTPKVQTGQELMRGYLDQEGETKEAAADFRERMSAQQQHLMRLIENTQPRESRVIDGEVVNDG